MVEHKRGKRTQYKRGYRTKNKKGKGTQHTRGRRTYCKMMSMGKEQQERRGRDEGRGIKQKPN
jgi:hypothetical protein